MARRTLGDGGAVAVSLVYAFLHYAMLVACEPTWWGRAAWPGSLLAWGSGSSVHATKLASSLTCLPADITKAGETVQGITGLPLPAADATFAAAFAALCYLASPSVLDKSNAVLVAAVVASFLVRWMHRPVCIPA